MASSQCDFATPTASFAASCRLSEKRPACGADPPPDVPPAPPEARSPAGENPKAPARPFESLCAGCGSARSWSFGSSRPRNADRPKAVRCAHSEQAREEAPGSDVGQRRDRSILWHRRCGARSQVRLSDGRTAPFSIFAGRHPGSMCPAAAGEACRRRAARASRQHSCRRFCRSLSGQAPFRCWDRRAPGTSCSARESAGSRPGICRRTARNRASPARANRIRTSSSDGRTSGPPVCWPHSNARRCTQGWCRPTRPEHSGRTDGHASAGGACLQPTRPQTRT